MKKIILLGGGGHCKVVIDALRTYSNIKIVGIVGLKNEVNSRIMDISVIGTDDDLAMLYKKGIRTAFVTVGSVGNPAKRIRIFKAAKKIGFTFPNIISTHAVVSKDCSMGEGNYIAPGAVVNAGSKLGDNCIINTGAAVDHDCTVGNFVHVAPGSILSGGVSVGDCSHIGVGASIIQGVTIGKNTIIGTGSVVTKDVKSDVVAYGVPCKQQRKTNE